MRTYPETTIEQDPAFALVDMTYNTKFEDLSDFDIDRAKKAILDTLAVMIGGSSYNCAPNAAKYAQRYSGFGESNIVVYGDKVPAAFAAYANGTMARAMDMGDCHNTGGHISEFNVPAMLSALNLADEKISGKKFIESYVVGAEWGTRHHTACHLQYHTTGVPGEAAWTWAGPSVGKMLGLSKEQIHNMMGMCYSDNGLPELQRNVEGTECVRLSHGMICNSVINSAMLAKDNVTGPHAIYLGKSGFLRFVIWDDVEPEILTKDLGKRWMWSEELAIKPFASCKFTHSLVSGMIKLRNKYNIDWHQIESMKAIVSPGAQCCMYPRRWDPHTRGDAMFGIPYTLATAAMTGDVFMDSFSEEELNNPEKRALMQRVSVEVSKDPDFPIFDGFPLEVTMKDGTKYNIADDLVPGNPKNPFTWEQLEEKFWKCVPYAAVKMPEEKLKKVVELCKNLENVEDMNELMDNLHN